MLKIDLIVRRLPGSSARGSSIASSWPPQLDLILSCGALPLPAGGAAHRLVLHTSSRVGAAARRHPPLLLPLRV